MLTRKALSSLLFLALAVCCSADTLTPLIAWSNGDVLSPGQPSTVGDFLNKVDFDQVKIAVVFKTSKLSFDEIAKYGGVYGEKNAALSTLQGELQSSKSTLWSGISSQPVASSLVDSLIFTMDSKPHYTTAGGRLNINEEGVTLLVVELPTGEGEEKFAAHDAAISQTLSQLKSSNPDVTYLAIYTADALNSNYREIQNANNVVHVYKHRELRQSDDNKEKYNATCAEVTNITDPNVRSRACVVFCLTDPNITRVLNVSKPEEYKNVTGFNITEGNTDYGGFPTITAEATVDNTEQETVTFVFVFPIGNRTDEFNRTEGDKEVTVRKSVLGKNFWRMDIYISDNEGSNQHFLRAPDGPHIYTQFAVPVGTAYACGANQLNAYQPFNVTLDATNETQYRFHGIQAEVNSYKPVADPNAKIKPYFASVYNCQSYVSYASWMGIFAILIIILFLYVANVFAFSIKSMDRFDDPRGPTISVENLH